MTPVRTAVSLFMALALVACVAFPAPAIHPFDSPPGIASVADAAALPVQLAPDVAVRIEQEAMQAEQASTLTARIIGEAALKASSQYQNGFATGERCSSPVSESLRGPCIQWDLRSFLKLQGAAGSAYLDGSPTTLRARWRLT